MQSFNDFNNNCDITLDQPLYLHQVWVEYNESFLKIFVDILKAMLIVENFKINSGENIKSKVRIGKVNL